METCILIPECLSLVMEPGSNDFGAPKVTLWASRVLERGQELHPEEGDVRLDVVECRGLLDKQDIRYKFGCYEEILDVEDQKVRHCNWVRFVSSSSCTSDANVTATIGKKGFRFKVTKDISPNEEIKVFFDTSSKKRKKEKMSLLQSLKSKKPAVEESKDNDENDYSVLFMRPWSAKPSKPTPPPKSFSPPIAIARRRSASPCVSVGARSRSKSPRLLAGSSAPSPLQKDSSMEAAKATPPQTLLHPSKSASPTELSHSTTQPTSSIPKLFTMESLLQKPHVPATSMPTCPFPLPALTTSATHYMPFRPNPVRLDPHTVTASTFNTSEANDSILRLAKSPVKLAEQKDTESSLSTNGKESGSAFSSVKKSSGFALNNSIDKSSSDTHEHHSLAKSATPPWAFLKSHASLGMSPFLNQTNGSMNSSAKNDDSGFSRSSLLDPSPVHPGTLQFLNSTNGTFSTPSPARSRTAESDMFVTPLKRDVPKPQKPSTSTPKTSTTTFNHTPSPQNSTPGSGLYLGAIPGLATSTPLKDQGYSSKGNSDSSPSGGSSSSSAHSGSPESNGVASPEQSAQVSNSSLSQPSFSTPLPDPSPSQVMRRREKTWLPCDICGKKFDRPSLLKRHMRTHTGEKPHACDVCGKAFSTSSSLNTHRRIHSGEKPHECQVCGKRFTASSNLYYHRMTHKKEKPHKCSLCSKSFPTPGDLKSHMYVHNGSWPHKCEVCNRGFSKLTNLKNHMLLHTGDKPHECPVCGKKFALQCNLKTHIKTHDDDTSTPCLRCNRKLPLTNGHCRDCVLPTDHLAADNKLPTSAFSIHSLVQKSQHTPTKDNIDNKTQLQKSQSGMLPGLYGNTMPGFYHMHEAAARGVHYGMQAPAWSHPSLQQQYGM